jgi:hypothetical protein
LLFRKTAEYCYGYTELTRQLGELEEYEHQSSIAVSERLTLDEQALDLIPRDAV